MSAFLGPIHHWLYNKVLWHEALLKEILHQLPQNLDESKSIIETGESEFGKAETRPLESVIDTNNIHGWLQKKIESLELRMAFTIHEALKSNLIDKTTLEALYESNGLKALNAVGGFHTSPEEAFKKMGDFLLDGMPCDRINALMSNSDSEVIWKKRTCIHTPFWDAVGADISVFNSLRAHWLKAFSGKGITYTEVSDKTYAFKRS